MSNNVGFFTAVKYNKNKTFKEFVLEEVDNYFYLGGKKAHVIQGKTKHGQEKALLAETNSSLLARFGKVISYFTVILPLLMLITKAVLRSTHTFRLIDPKKKLEKGIDISEETISKIQGLIPKILSRQEDDEIEWLSTGNNLVFKLQANPQLVFKIAPPNCFPGNDKLPTGGSEKTIERFKNMVKAKEVCVANQLGLLIIPNAKKFNVNTQGNTYIFIAEENLKVHANESYQEHLYHTHSTELNKTARQLAIFVAKTGFNDVTWRNIPILNEAPKYSGPRRVGLIDVEHMKSVVNGFKGDLNGSRGLIRCATSEEQIDAIIEEARKQGVALTSKEAQDMKQQRLDELEADKQLQRIYKQNGIVTGKEPIQVDLDSLNLDLTEEGQIRVPVADETAKHGFKWEKQTITLRKVTEDVVAEINKLIQESSNTASVKGKRYIVLNTNAYPFMQYNSLGIPSEKFLINEEDKKNLWLRRIIQSLVEKGHVFKLDKVNGEYFIQA